MMFRMRYPLGSWPNVAPAAVESLANCTEESLRAEIASRRLLSSILRRKSIAAQNSTLPNVRVPDPTTDTTRAGSDPAAPTEN